MFTKSATRLAGCILCFALIDIACADTLREKVLRQAAISTGLVPAHETHEPVSPEMVAVGHELFQSKILSLDRETACATCHIDKFGSTDGLPNAVGTLGRGEGAERLDSGGDILPRNTLPLWGRGGKGFDVFFWDGKVDGSSGQIRSQFAGDEPSSDTLVVAVHLPPVEIGEMVSDIPKNDHLEAESVGIAQSVYAALLERVKSESDLGAGLANARRIDKDKLTFLDIATALAAFIRENYAVQQTRFHEYVFSDGALKPNEMAGGLLFYGKGRCATCHNGAYFSDLDFHALPFPQAGFGKNGFGVDYGRFNVTMDDRDRDKFRTPPLFNVTRTAPFSHSGSVVDLGDAIRAHTDPLVLYKPEAFSAIERVEFYRKLKAWSGEPVHGVHLDNDEIANLIAFLGTLEYESKRPVATLDD